MESMEQDGTKNKPVRRQATKVKAQDSDNSWHKKEAFLAEYLNNGFNVKKACDKVGINREAFYQWKKKDKQFLTLYNEQTQVILDHAKQALFRMLSVHRLEQEQAVVSESGVDIVKLKRQVDPDPSMIRLAFKLVGKYEGFEEKEKMEVDVKSVTLNVTKEDLPKLQELILNAKKSK